MTTNSGLIKTKYTKEDYKSRIVAFTVACIVMTYVGFFYITEGGHIVLTDDIFLGLAAIFAFVAFFYCGRYEKA